MKPGWAFFTMPQLKGGRNDGPERYISPTTAKYSLGFDKKYAVFYSGGYVPSRSASSKARPIGGVG